MASFPYKVRISPDVISQEVLLGETVLMDVGRLVYFGLDELGSEVWKEIGRCPAADRAFSRLLESTNLSRQELEPKFNMIIRGLEQSRIITLESSAE